MQSLINIDQNIFYWFNSFVNTSLVFDFIIKVIAVYIIYFIPLIFLYFWFFNSNEKIKKYLIEIFTVLVISWQFIARIIGMIINRPRPSGFEGTKELLFHPPTYAFPSDHALFLAALTTYLYLSGYKKIGNIALFLTIAISISRVIAGFHWPGDVLAGWMLGVFLAYMFYLIRKPVEKYIVNPLYWIATKIKLI